MVLRQIPSPRDWLPRTKSRIRTRSKSLLIHSGWPPAARPALRTRTGSGQNRKSKNASLRQLDFSGFARAVYEMEHRPAVESLHCCENGRWERSTLQSTDNSTSESVRVAELHHICPLASDLQRYANGKSK